MKTIEQCLEGVTAGGKWEKSENQHNGPIIKGVADFGSDPDAAYAARACSTWPDLVRALLMADAYVDKEGTSEERKQVYAALSKALAD